MAKDSGRMAGRMDMVRRWSRVRKSVEADDRSIFLGAFLGSVAVASVAYFVWQHYNKPTKKSRRSKGVQ